jgi:hypothetical protein
VTPMKTARDEYELPIERDPFRVAAMPLVTAIIEVTTEGSQQRSLAVREVMRSVERVRSILSQRYWN